MNLHQITAKDIMTERVRVVTEKMLIKHVAHLMLRDKVSGFPVVNNEQKIIGIITVTDLLHLMEKIFQNKKGDAIVQLNEYKELSISEVMSRNVLMIAPTTTLEEIINTVVKLKIHTFPVMEKDKLVGIIGRHDVLNAIFQYGGK